MHWIAYIKMRFTADLFSRSFKVCKHFTSDQVLSGHRSQLTALANVVLSFNSITSVYLSRSTGCINMMNRQIYKLNSNWTPCNSSHKPICLCNAQYCTHWTNRHHRAIVCFVSLHSNRYIFAVALLLIVLGKYKYCIYVPVNDFVLHK